MVNKPKAIGTFAETSTLKAILPYFPDAKRITLHGRDDQGDIDTGDHADFLIEVKGGKQCQQIGDGKLAGWMLETAIETRNLGKRFGFLVTQRAGFGGPRALHWWAWVKVSDLATWTGGFYAPDVDTVVRLELGALLELLSDNDFLPDKDFPSAGERPWVFDEMDPKLVMQEALDATP
jgi:hypothetical protein